MGKLFVDPQVHLDGLDISDWCHNIDMPFEAPRVKVTGFRAAFNSYIQGRKDGVITLGVWNDFAPGSIDDTLWDLWSSGETFELRVEPQEEEGVRYTCSCVLETHNPLSGEEGEAATSTLTLPLNGADPIERTRFDTESA